MQIEQIERGFGLVNFVDLTGKECSLQKSSRATSPAIWLGIPGNRMHLTREMVADLLPFLTAFALTGEIGLPTSARVTASPALLAQNAQSEDNDAQD